MNSKALAPGSAGASLIPGTPGSDIFVRPYAPLPVQLTSPKIKVSKHQAVVDYRLDPENANNYTSILPSIKQNLVRGSPAQTFLKTAILRPPRLKAPYQSKTPHRVRMADQLLFEPIAESPLPASPPARLIRKQHLTPAISQLRAQREFI